MHVFGHCLSHDEPKFNAWTHHNCLNLVCYEWTQAQKPMIEIYLVWKPKIVSWMSLSPTPEPIKGAWRHEQHQRPKTHKMRLPSVSPSHSKQRPFHHNQGSSTPSLKHPKWTKKKQVAQLCLTPHMVCNIMVKLKIWLFIQCFYFFLNSKISCSI